MKRVKVTFLAQETFTKKDFEQFIVAGVLEIEHYDEKIISKESNVVTEHSFDSLLEGAFEFFNGIWMALKGFGKMSMFAIVVIFSGLKYLWSNGVGKKKGVKKEEKVKEKNNDVVVTVKMPGK
jgi:hypothetical protein